MRFLTAVATVFSVAGSPLAALVIDKYAGETTGKHIVRLRDGANKTSLLSQVRATNGQVTHNWDLINAFAGLLSGTQLRCRRAYLGYRRV